jgi:hypothetical protein
MGERHMWVGTIGGITILRIQRDTMLVWLFRLFLIHRIE